MKRLVAGALAVAVTALSACVGQNPVDGVTPSPSGTPAPAVSATPTPSQAELSAMAEKTYRAFFDEWKRLEWEGGALEPTTTLTAHGADPYLEMVMSLLRDQERLGYTYSGSRPMARVVPAPGESLEDSDPRLTLQVCENSPDATYTYEGREQQISPVQGYVYLKQIDGRLKVVQAATEVVPECTF